MSSIEEKWVTIDIPSDTLRTCEQLHAARCSLRAWWEMPR